MIVYSNLLSGHRREYLDFISELLNCKSLSGQLSLRQFVWLIKEDVVIFTTIDDNYLQFICLSFLRAVIFRKTIGIFLRPQTCFNLGFKFRLKWLVFRIIKIIKKIKVLTIMDHRIKTEFSTISDGSFVDFHCWDLVSNLDKNDNNFWQSDKQHVLDESFDNSLNKIVFPGSINETKGLKKLIEVSQSVSFNQNYQLILAGKVHDACYDKVESLRLKGAILMDEFIPRNKLFTFIANSSFVWCHYSEEYDQASGFVGRALQLGSIPIVRQDSYSEMFCRLHQIKFSIFCIESQKLKVIEGIEQEHVFDLCISWRNQFLNSIYC